jgi:putative tRNA adenosine deaminase-associated protein
MRTMARDGSDLPTDFAVVAWREEGQWQLTSVVPRAADSLVGLERALRANPSESGAIGLVSYVEEYFLVARTVGNDVRFLLSDVGAAPDWPLAAEVLDRLGLPMPDEDDLEQVQPAGDLSLLEDLGMDPMELSMLCENLDMYADEALAAIATRLGFGEQFETVLDTVLD